MFKMQSAMGSIVAILLLVGSNGVRLKSQSNQENVGPKKELCEVTTNYTRPRNETRVFEQEEYLVNRDTLRVITEEQNQWPDASFSYAEQVGMKQDQGTSGNDIRGISNEVVWQGTFGNDIPGISNELIVKDNGDGPLIQKSAKEVTLDKKSISAIDVVNDQVSEKVDLKKSTGSIQVDQRSEVTLDKKSISAIDVVNNQVSEKVDLKKSTGSIQVDQRSCNEMYKKDGNFCSEINGIYSYCNDKAISGSDETFGKRCQDNKMKSSHASQTEKQKTAGRCTKLFNKVTAILCCGNNKKKPESGNRTVPMQMPASEKAPMQASEKAKGEEEETEERCNLTESDDSEGDIKGKPVIQSIQVAGSKSSANEGTVPVIMDEQKKEISAAKTPEQLQAINARVDKSGLSQGNLQGLENEINKQNKVLVFNYNRGHFEAKTDIASSILDFQKLENIEPTRNIVRKLGPKFNLVEMTKQPQDESVDQEPESNTEIQDQVLSEETTTQSVKGLQNIQKENTAPVVEVARDNDESQHSVAAVAMQKEGGEQEKEVAWSLGNWRMYLNALGLGA